MIGIDRFAMLMTLFEIGEYEHFNELIEYMDYDELGFFDFRAENCNEHDIKFDEAVDHAFLFVAGISAIADFLELNPLWKIDPPEGDIPF